MLRLHHDSNIMLIGLLVRWLCIGVLMLGFAACNGKQSNNAEDTASLGGIPAAVSEELTDARAVSLRVLQDEVQRYLSGKNSDLSVLQLCGITKVLGYVMDNQDSDVVLIGSINKALPALHLEDFVVALRNACQLYITVEGNTRYYSSPGCSIDPNPEVLQRLQQIHRSVLACQQIDQVQNHLDRWAQTCGQLQKVRVLGIPADTRFAKIMVDADYAMKRIVDGTEKLHLTGFQSLTDMTLDVLQEQVRRHGRITMPLHSMNRFWFVPGGVHFLESDRMLVLDQSKVVLLTQKEFVDARGEITGSDEVDTLATRFAENFSGRYPEIARVRSIYAELDGLFRFVAIANVLKLRDDCSSVNLSIDYLLREYPVKSTFVSSALPGRSNIRQVARRTETTEGYTQHYLWLPTCGGVSIDVHIKTSDRARVKSRDGERITKSVLNARPSSRALRWDFSVK